MFTGSVLPRLDLNGHLFVVARHSRPLDDSIVHASIDNSSRKSPNLQLIEIDFHNKNINNTYKNTYNCFWVSPTSKKIISSGDGYLLLETLRGSTEERHVFDLPQLSVFSHHGAWSPDEERFVISFLSQDLQGPPWSMQTNIVYINKKFCVKTPIATTDAVEDWSSDGEWFLVLSRNNPSDKSQICLIRPDGTERQLLATESTCTSARFSPDGSRIASTRGARDRSLLDEQGSVWIMDKDAKNNYMIFGNRNFICQSVRWSPDGECLAASGFCRPPDQIQSSYDPSALKAFVVIIDTKNNTHENISILEDYEIYYPPWIEWR